MDNQVSEAVPSDPRGGSAKALNHWTPILLPSDPRAPAAWAAIEAIALALLERDYPARRQGRIHEESLLFAYLARATNSSEWYERSLSRMNSEIAGVSRSQWHFGLFGGIAGLGWSAEHLGEVLDGMEPASADEEESNIESRSDEDDLNQETDTAVLEALRKNKWLGRYDLIGGLVGIGLYFLERYPFGESQAGLEEILNCLESTAEYDGAQVTWHTPPEFLPEWQRESCPQGYYNLGVAHGVPGVIQFLGEVFAAGVEKERTLRLLDGAMTWLIAQQRPSSSRSTFGSWVSGGESSGTRLAWCYGDLGITAVLLQVASRIGQTEWKRFADDLLDRCLACPWETAGVKDAPLCHGASGNAHIFNRIYQNSGNPRCRATALTWFDRALEMRKPGTGVGGFSAFSMPDRNGPPVWEATAAFLDGSIGVALALLAALTPVAPGWDRLLQLSGRSWGAND